MDALGDVARTVGDALDRLGVVASARRHGEELARVVVDAHAAGLERLVELAADRLVLEGDPDLAEVLWVHRPFKGDPNALAGLPERVDGLLNSIAQTGIPGLVDAGEQLLDELTALYGWALAHAVELLHEAGDTRAVRATLDDTMVASLLLAHGLHPDPLEQRVQRALDALAPTLGEHGSRAILTEVTAEDVVRVEVVGGDARQRWRSRLAVERALEQALPEAPGIEVSGAEAGPTLERGETVFVPLSAIRRRQQRPTRWMAVPELAELADLEARRIACDGMRLVACRVGRDFYVVVDEVTLEPPDLSGADGLRVVSVEPPTVQDRHGAIVVFSDPLPTHVSDAGVEVSVP